MSMSIYGALGENIGEQPLDPPEYPEEEDEEEEDEDPCEGCFNDCDGCEHKQEMEDLPCDAAIRAESAELLRACGEALKAMAEPGTVSWGEIKRCAQSALAALKGAGVKE